MKVTDILTTVVLVTTATAFPFMALVKDGIMDERGVIDTPELIAKLKAVFGDPVFTPAEMVTLNQQFGDAMEMLKRVPVPAPHFLNTTREVLSRSEIRHAYGLGTGKHRGKGDKIWPPTDMGPYRAFPPSYTHGPVAHSPTHVTRDSVREYQLPTPNFDYHHKHGWGPAENDAHPWFPPTHGETRGPCPGLNAAANHGYLPRSGIVTPVQLLVGLWEAFSLSPDMAQFLGFMSFAFQGDPAHMTLSIGTNKDVYGNPMPNHLGTGIGVHGVLEGDGSVTRADHNLGVVWPLDKDLYHQFLGEMEAEGGVSVKSLSAARLRAWNNTMSNNAEGDFNPWRMIVAYVESGFSHEALRGDSDIFTPQMVESWFYYERFPPGWQRRKVPITTAEMLAWGSLVWEATPASPRPTPGWMVSGSWVPLTAFGSLTNIFTVFTTGRDTNTIDDLGCAFKKLLYNSTLFSFFRKMVPLLSLGGHTGVYC